MSYIFDLFQETLKKKNYNYYDESNCKQYSINELFNNSESFIIEYIQQGDKLNDLCDFPNIKMRYQHIVSTYFLGIIFYQKCGVIKKNIDNLICELQTKVNDVKINFLYIWFLTCLFHDLGYYYENNLNENNYNLHKIKYFPSRPMKIPQKIIKNWKKYFFYKLINMKKVDHGIIAGVILFNSLKNYYLKLKIKYEKETFVHNGLKWSPKILLVLQNITCWAIISHNIWFINYTDESVTRYNNYGISDLVIQQGQPKPVNIKNHPLLFILGLVDTIEPLKVFDSSNIIKLIKQINIEFDENSIEINYNGYKDELYDEWVKNICLLNVWLKININANNTTIKIKI